MSTGESMHITTSLAASVLGVRPQNLRRWVREGKFDDIDGMEWDQQPGFQRQRIYTQGWVEVAATRLGVTPDWTKVSS